MTTVAWKVLAKMQVDEPRDDGVSLVLIVEREGRVRRAVVSGHTWIPAEVGGEVELRKNAGVHVEWPPKEET